ncbi:MAG: haloacid dehalogenase type II [Candidatus Dormibacteraceae bacterium]
MTPDDTVLVFDVNETLLDLSGLDARFEQLFGDPSLCRQWFGQMLQLSFVGAITGRYLDFPGAQRAALQMLARRQQVVLGAAEEDSLVDAMASLPPHPDVADGLGRLRAAGWRLFSLTNSPLEIAERQLINAGLRVNLEKVFSADEVKRLKPAPEAYWFVARRLNLAPERLCLVAAHAWDVSGALAAGCRAAFVSRGGSVPSPAGAQPNFEVADISALADRLAT